MSQVDLSKQEKTKPQQLLETTMELNSITWKSPQSMGPVLVVANFIQVLATMQLVELQSDRPQKVQALLMAKKEGLSQAILTKTFWLMIIRLRIILIQEIQT
jgi:hypothetical protein